MEDISVKSMGEVKTETENAPQPKYNFRIAAGAVSIGCVGFALLAITLLWTVAVALQVNAFNNNIVGGNKYLSGGELAVCIVATVFFALSAISNGVCGVLTLRAENRKLYITSAALGALDIISALCSLIVISTLTTVSVWWFALFIIPFAVTAALKIYFAKIGGRDGDLMSYEKRNKIKEATTDYVYYVICGIILALLAVIVIYPLYYIVIASISDPDAVMTGEVWILPIKITFSGYARLFERSDIWSSYGNTIIYTVLGTVFNIILTIPAGWALSRDYLPCRKVIMGLLIVTMFFGGGLIPYLIVCEALGLVENPLILIIGGGVSVYNVFMCKSFFETNVPQEVLEAGQIDGCGEVRTFFDLVLPISKSIISVMVLFYAVGHWNNYIDSYIFMIDKQYWPLQTVLNEILTVSSSGAGDTILEQMRIATQIKYTSIIVATAPILILYPFVEKHFGQGVLVGSFK